MSKFVNFQGQAIPAVLFEPQLKTRYECTICSDTGYTREHIDNERFDVMAPCWNCRPYCKICKRSRNKEHACDA